MNNIKLPSIDSLHQIMEKALFCGIIDPTNIPDTCFECSANKRCKYFLYLNNSFEKLEV